MITSSPQLIHDKERKVVEFSRIHHADYLHAGWNFIMVKNLWLTQSIEDGVLKMQDILKHNPFLFLIPPDQHKNAHAYPFPHWDKVDAWS